MVKTKSLLFKFFPMRATWSVDSFLPVLSVLTFILSWLAIFPSSSVERWYARGIFPKISHLAGAFADAVAFSWLDLAIPAAAVFLVLVVRKRRWKILVNAAAALYLIFFWSWGLNYHRQPLNSKLQVDSARMQPQAMTAFATRVGSE